MAESSKMNLIKKRKEKKRAGQDCHFPQGGEELKRKVKVSRCKVVPAEKRWVLGAGVLSAMPPTCFCPKNTSKGRARVSSCIDVCPLGIVGRGYSLAPEKRKGPVPVLSPPQKRDGLGCASPTGVMW